MTRMLLLGAAAALLMTSGPSLAESDSVRPDRAQGYALGWDAGEARVILAAADDDDRYDDDRDDDDWDDDDWDCDDWDDDDRRWTERLSGPLISQFEAVAIARNYGVDRVREVDFDDGEWEVEGWDRSGRKIEVEMTRRGRVLEVEYDD